MKSDPKVKPACPDCGSFNVSKMATLRWDIDSQEWTVSNSFEATCSDCDYEGEGNAILWVKELPKVEMDIVTVVEITGREMERVIREFYGREYEIVPDMELDNSVYVVKLEGQLDDYGEKELTRWIETGKGSYIFKSIGNDLCRRGILPAGTFNIDVTW